MDEQPTPANACSQCQKPTSLCCTGCMDAPIVDLYGETNNTYYCTTECQKTNWESHEELCKRLQTRKTLYRAGETLQEIYYNYRERIFDRKVSRVEEKNGHLQIQYKVHQPFLEPKLKNGELRPMSDFILPFPTSLCSTAKERHAVAAYSDCVDALAWMHEIIKYMLEDLVSEIIELQVIPKNCPRQVVMVDDNLVEERLGLGRHSIIKLSLKQGGESYAMELAGAQYGYYDTIIPWQEYLDKRVLCIPPTISPKYFGMHKDRLLQGLYECQDKDTVFAVLHKNSESSKSLMRSTLAWETEEKMTVQEMLRLPLPTYLNWQPQLLRSLASGVEAFLREEDKKYEQLRAASHAATDEAGSPGTEPLGDVEKFSGSS